MVWADGRCRENTCYRNIRTQIQGLRTPRGQTGISLKLGAPTVSWEADTGETLETQRPANPRLSSDLYVHAWHMYPPHNHEYEHVCTCSTCTHTHTKIFFNLKGYTRIIQSLAMNIISKMKTVKNLRFHRIHCKVHTSCFCTAKEALALLVSSSGTG